MPVACLPAARSVRVRRWGLCSGVLALVVLLTGCQVDLQVGVKVHDDGSGSVTVAAGLDAAALARVGHLDQQLRTDDLEASGWVVTAPSREGDRTWIRATKSFDTPDEGSAVLGELTGVDGPFRGFRVDKSDSTFATDYAVDGVVDLTGGPQAFGDDELRALLGGDAYGGTLGAIEQAEGRPIADMVSFQVVVELPGATKTYTASFADHEPTQVAAHSSQRGALTSLFILVLVGLVGVIALVMLRRGYKRDGR